MKTEIEIDVDKFKCPTCAKVQHWQDNCQLCGSDVSQLRSLAANYFKLHNQLRTTLQNGDLTAAQKIAQKLVNITPTTLNKKILKFLKDTSNK